MELEIHGRTQTERLIYLALSLKQLKKEELEAVVGGSPVHLGRLLKPMMREGWVRRVGEKYEALSPAERADWLTPAAHWTLDEGELSGSIGGKFTLPVRIPHKGLLDYELRRLREASWFTLGDEQAIQALFPQFAGVADGQ